MTHWEGPDARQFLEWWEHEHKPPMVAAQETLNRLSGAAKQAAVDQERISGA